jgi:hypothetical protein
MVMLKNTVQLTLRKPVLYGDTASRVLLIDVPLYLAASVVRIGSMVFDV